MAAQDFVDTVEIVCMVVTVQASANLAWGNVPSRQGRFGDLLEEKVVGCAWRDVAAGAGR